jgi:hypothetical protein
MVVTVGRGGRRRRKAVSYMYQLHIWGMLGEGGTNTGIMETQAVVSLVLVPLFVLVLRTSLLGVEGHFITSGP